MTEKGKLEPRLDTLEIVKNEQVEAIADPVNRDILNLMQNEGAFTAPEISEKLEMDIKEIEQYLSGLIAVGLLDEVSEKDKKFFVPRARYFAVKTGELPGSEGMSLVQQLLVQRVAEMAQELSRLEIEDAQKGTITVDEVKVPYEELEWIEERLGKAYREIAERIEKIPHEKRDTNCRFAFFFYPKRD